MRIRKPFSDLEQMERWFKRQPPPICILPWYALYMAEMDGAVFGTPCCVNWINRSFGSFRGRRIMEVWNSPEAQHLRQLLVEGRHDEVCSPVCPCFLSGRFEEPPSVPENASANLRARLEMAKSDFDEGKTEARSPPLLFRYIPTLRCNLRCSMCPQDRDTELELPHDIQDQIISILPDLLEILLHGGEIFVSPEFYRFLQPHHFEKNEELRVAITTNGTLLDGPPLMWLENSRLSHITVSLNAARAETYRQITGQDLFSMTVENVRRLVDLSSRHPWGPFKINLSMVLMAQNQGDLEAFVNLVEELGVQLRLVPVTGSHHGQDLQKNVKEDLVRRIHILLQDHPWDDLVWMEQSLMADLHGPNRNPLGTPR